MERHPQTPAEQHPEGHYEYPTPKKATVLDAVKQLDLAHSSFQDTGNQSYEDVYKKNCVASRTARRWKQQGSVRRITTRIGRPIRLDKARIEALKG